MSASAADPLAPLGVWERLEVGPVRMEPERLITPYRLTHGGKSESVDLIYRWEEPVFDTARRSAENLGSMIGAQLALNYGLFCDELVFHGAFDDLDRAFLTRYASHTAREIYVNKFLLHNPFLTGAAAQLEPIRRKDYLRARVEFHDAPAELPARRRAAIDLPDDGQAGGYAILASGGKDSLLSYGLMREVAGSAHSIFVNESGRHWFTALNAYRHLRDTDPNTARVWTNSDRVFAWMLRRMPFIRPDFAQVRSDEYPVRLWTVAVFLFGALPLLRKRGIGRLLIGDEFDCTVRRRHRGITHYAGLFDQSRFFDNAMTRYLMGKGWDVQQFSVLRPLSEMLIEKVLAERYPELQAHQVSCHAAHEERGRIRPCGKCEKCRRVVAMLTAIDADPRRCGYSDEQIAACFQALVERGVNQEQAAVEHTLHQLRSTGKLPEGGSSTRAHPEVMKLRFDPERSPFETIPADLREPLYRILLEHADGAVQRVGRTWRRCDPLSRRARAAVYRYERAGAEGAPADSSDEIRLGLLTWPQARQRFQEVDVALLPVGATEQHGAHLTLDTDSYDAERLALDVAAACSAPRPLVLPPIPYGVSYHHDDFAGTLSVSPDSLARLVHDVGMAAARNGVRKLVIINGHGGNIPTLHFAAQLINRDARIFTCVDTGETSDADVYAIAQTPNDVHAGEIETSTSLHLRPDHVWMERARREVPRFSSPYLDFTSQRSIGWYGRTRRISRSGVMGDPTVASADKGRRMWELMVSHLVRLCEDLKRLTLDEIHQRRI